MSCDKLIVLVVFLLALTRLHHGHPVRRGRGSGASAGGRRTAAPATGWWHGDTLPPSSAWPDSYFDIEASSDVAVVVGQNAFLTCRVQVAGNWTVSWVRHHDIHLLTVGTDTYTADPRFRGLHVANSADWTLQIKAATPNDAGDYECQLSSTPLRTHVVRLRVVEPHVTIANGREVYLHQGSTLNLTCVISPAIDASLLLWSHNGQVLNWLYQSTEDGSARIHVYDGRLWVDRGGGGGGGGGGVAAAADAGSSTVSELVVERSQMHHSGRYVCSTPKSLGTWTQVHVLAEEEPAAMQRGNSHSRSAWHPLLACWIAGVLYLVL